MLTISTSLRTGIISQLKRAVTLCTVAYEARAYRGEYSEAPRFAEEAVLSTIGRKCVERAMFIQALRLASALLASISTIVELRSNTRLARRKTQIKSCAWA